MSNGISKFLGRHHTFLVSGLATTSVVILLRIVGVLETWELAAFDRLVQLRPLEPRDQRIVLVGIEEADLQHWQQSTLSDQTVADLIGAIAAQKPRVIGLDLYRNLPVEPGHQALQTVLRNTPNVIGIEKVVGDARLPSVSGNRILAQSDRLAASDIHLDVDGRVRRALLFPNAQKQQPLESLGLRLALDYLQPLGIQPDATAMEITLQGKRFPPLQRQDGSYATADMRGYQLLLNPRGGPGHFWRVSARDVLQQRVSPALFQDRIVIIGYASPASTDTFLTSYSSQPGQPLSVVYGIELHATLTSQIISTVLDNRSSIQLSPVWVEWGLVLIVAYGSVALNRRSEWSTLQRVTGSGGFLGTIALISYGAILVGWWLPLVPATLALMAVTAVATIHESLQLRILARHDELTQLANRRTFNETLEREWERAMRSQRPLAVILCDVDFFKRYNDTYGHPQGDECLRQVARALKLAMRRSSDLAARYGGEEFVMLLPNTDAQTALKLAHAAQASVKALRLAHRESSVSEFVTLSLGVSCVIPSAELLPESLVNLADLSLYEAKHKGRNQAVLKQITDSDR